MQPRRRRRHVPKRSLGKTFSRVAYELILALAGGMIGAVTAIYYERMIPLPSAGLLGLRLFLTLAIIIVIFLAILVPMRHKAAWSD